MAVKNSGSLLADAGAFSAYSIFDTTNHISRVVSSSAQLNISDAATHFMYCTLNRWPNRRHVSVAVKSWICHSRTQKGLILEGPIMFVLVLI